MPEEITIKDVAKLVGFSTGTVSRVLNGAPNVNPEINSRILRVLKESGYLAKERYRDARPAEIHDRQAAECGGQKLQKQVFEHRN